MGTNPGDDGKEVIVEMRRRDWHTLGILYILGKRERRGSHTIYINVHILTAPVHGSPPTDRTSNTRPEGPLDPGGHLRLGLTTVISSMTNVTHRLASLI